MSSVQKGSRYRKKDSHVLFAFSLVSGFLVLTAFSTSPKRVAPGDMRRDSDREAQVD